MIWVFVVIDCWGLVRVDFFFIDDGLVINEINMMLGFIMILMYLWMWVVSGVDYLILLVMMIEMVLVCGVGLY